MVIGAALAGHPRTFSHAGVDIVNIPGIIC
jgi:hypothetical protein